MAQPTNTELQLAYEMLSRIEQGGSYTLREWDNTMARIELALGKATPRSTWLTYNICTGQATPTGWQHVDTSV